VRHEAADAESAPMPLAMPCLVPRHGGGSVAGHEHRAKGRSHSTEKRGAVEQLKRTALPYYNIGTEGEKVVKVASLSTPPVG
jgi:predicted transcriptional regulator with HTH domain